MKEYDVVKLNRDIPERKLKKGCQGVIMMVFNEPNLPLAYEIEFINKEGVTIAVETIKKEYLDLVISYNPKPP